MEDIEQANRIKTLGSDPVFRELGEVVREEQVAVFIKPTGSPEDREEAHAIVRALSRILGHITSANNTVMVAERRGQDRDGD